MDISFNTIKKRKLNHTKNEIITISTNTSSSSTTKNNNYNNYNNNHDNHNNNYDNDYDEWSIKNIKIKLFPLYKIKFVNKNDYKCFQIDLFFRFENIQQYLVYLFMV